MKHFIKLGAAFLVLLLFIIGLNSIYIVEPDELAVVQRFGKTVACVVSEGNGEAVAAQIAASPLLEQVKVQDTRGLLFKLPFVDHVDKYTSKYLTYRSQPEIINTSDKRKLDVEMYAQYNIQNPAIYKMRVRSYGQLNQIMDDNVYPVVIQSANKLTFDQFFNDEVMTSMMEERRIQLNKSLIEQYGIEIADIGIYRKNFPQSNIESIEAKMSMEIQKESEQLRAEGDAYYTEFTSNIDRQSKEIIAKATEESAIIRAEAEKEALEIYQSVLSKDVEFYRFIQRMSTFKTLKDQTIFLDQDNDFLKYLNGYTP